MLTGLLCGLLVLPVQDLGDSLGNEDQQRQKSIVAFMLRTGRIVRSWHAEKWQSSQSIVFSK